MGFIKIWQRKKALLGQKKPARFITSMFNENISWPKKLLHRLQTYSEGLDVNTEYLYYTFNRNRVEVKPL